MTAVERTGPTTRIAAVEAYVIVGDKDYVGGAGLRPPATAGPERRRALAEIGDRHICVYPPQAQSCLVKITAEDGTVGWGEGHAPLGPRATAAVVQDVLAPLLVGEDPLAIEKHWERMYGSMRLRGHVAGYQLEAIAGVDIALWDRAASAERFIADGYTAMKASIGRGSLDEDLAAIGALVETIAGRADVLVDAHGAYASHTALYVGRELQRLGVKWLEDPLPPEDV